MTDHHSDMLSRAMEMERPKLSIVQPVRELWQPDRHEQLAACETLLRGPIPYEVRLVIRDLEQTIRTGKEPS